MFRNYIYQFAYQISTTSQGNEEVEKCVVDAMSTLAGKVHFIKEGKTKLPISGTGNKTIKDPAKCWPKGISNARLKDHWEKRKSKKVKSIMQNPPTSIHFTLVESGSQSSFMIFKLVSSVVGLGSGAVLDGSGALLDGYGALLDGIFVGLGIHFGLGGVAGDGSGLIGLSTVIGLSILIGLGGLGGDGSSPVGLGTLIRLGTDIGLAGVRGNLMGDLEEIFVVFEGIGTIWRCSPSG
ncbi:hypothetical protein MA16_Dca026008 [Dendrobium catenatum]|uniref:Uncharacterized protein n=1 Tax=Dendrobium catenatum TaxID=906689 RepID=A0A2I0VJ49_9ASPA|nr:hypothetical protein MA16_Dca026008 [Dendrobium catenatum]